MPVTESDAGSSRAPSKGLTWKLWVAPRSTRRRRPFDQHCGDLEQRIRVRVEAARLDVDHDRQEAAEAPRHEGRARGGRGRFVDSAAARSAASINAVARSLPARQPMCSPARSGTSSSVPNGYERGTSHGSLTQREAALVARQAVEIRAVLGGERFQALRARRRTRKLRHRARSRRARKRCRRSRRPFPSRRARAARCRCRGRTADRRSQRRRAAPRGRPADFSTGRQ